MFLHGFYFFNLKRLVDRAHSLAFSDIGRALFGAFAGFTPRRQVRRLLRLAEAVDFYVLCFIKSCDSAYPPEILVVVTVVVELIGMVHHHLRIFASDFRIFELRVVVVFRVHFLCFTALVSGFVGLNLELTAVWER